MVSKAELAQILSATLNADTNTRVEAELKLAEAFVQPSMAFRDELTTKTYA